MITSDGTTLFVGDNLGNLREFRINDQFINHRRNSKFEEIPTEKIPTQSNDVKRNSIVINICKFNYI